MAPSAAHCTMYSRRNQDSVHRRHTTQLSKILHVPIRVRPRSTKAPHGTDRNCSNYRSVGQRAPFLVTAAVDVVSYDRTHHVQLYHSLSSTTSFGVERVRRAVCARTREEEAREGRRKTSAQRSTPSYDRPLCGARFATSASASEGAGTHSAGMVLARRSWHGTGTRERQHPSDEERTCSHDDSYTGTGTGPGTGPPVPVPEPGGPVPVR